MIGLRNLLLLLSLAWTGLAYAVIETYEFSDPQLQQRYQQLSGELRCPKCQNQNIADSNAPIAQDLRKLLYQQLEEGATDDEVLDYMVARYGEFVRYRPAFSGPTMVLWLAPGLLFLAAGMVVFMTLRNRRSDKSQVHLSTDEQQQLQQLLGDKESKS